jgi:hypothetical protein
MPDKLLGIAQKRARGVCLIEAKHKELFKVQKNAFLKEYLDYSGALYHKNLLNSQPGDELKHYYCSFKAEIC